MEQFDYIKVEGYIKKSGESSFEWVDLTPDLIYNPHPTFTRGNTSPTPTTLVADPGTFKFTLDNSATNSAGTLGYYSPDHPDSISPQNAITGRGGWGPGTPIRVSFAYDVWQPYYKWRGEVDKGGIRVYSGTKGQRRVDVTCSDFVRVAADHKLNLLQSQSNKSPAETIALVLANMPQPSQAELGDENFDRPLRVEYRTFTGDNFPSVFDNTGPDTTALSEFEKVAQSAPLRIYVTGDLISGETLKFNPDPSQGVPLVTSEAGTLLQENGDAILQENGDLLLLDDTEQPHFTDADIGVNSEFTYGEHISNYLTIHTYPRELGTSATAVLWALQEPMLLEAGESVSLRGAYTNPDGGGRIYGTDFVAPVSGTDYAAFANADGTGTNYTADLSVGATFGSGEVSIGLTNTGANDFYTGGTAIPFQVRGRTIIFNDTANSVASDSGSRGDYGVKPITIDMKYRSNPVGLSSQTQTPYLSTWADPKPGVRRLELLANRDPSNMCAFLFAEPPITCSITESMSGLDEDSFTLTGYTAEIVDSQTVIWYPNFI